MSMLEVWVWVKLSSLQGFFDFATVVSCVFAVATLLFLIPANTVWDDEHPDKDDHCIASAKAAKAIFLRLSNLRKYSISVAVIFILLSLFTPTTKEFAVIYLVPKIINNEQIQSVASDGLQCMKNQMEAWLDEQLSAKQGKQPLKPLKEKKS